MTNINRRQALATLAATSTLSLLGNAALAEAPQKTNYILASPMYGYAPLAQIVPEVAKTGATHIDIWPKVHGNQREQLDEMGEAAFVELLKKHNVKLGCITQYKLGPFGLQDEMRLAQRLGCKLIVCGGKGPRGLKGAELKQAVKTFIEQLKPHLAVAEETGVTIAIENHGNNLIESPDSMKWLADLRPSKHLAIAFAPYHLPQEEKQLASLLKELGNRTAMFYAWQHGMGCHKKLPKEQELLQMPGRGSLDFAPLMTALSEIKYNGWTEIFMHPVPRGVPILGSNKDITDEINRSRAYLRKCQPIS
jgi:sugar phosphate isomerase/epimerase